LIIDPSTAGMRERKQKTTLNPQPSTLYSWPTGMPTLSIYLQRPSTTLSIYLQRPSIMLSICHPLLELNQSWSHEEVTAFLKNLLLLPFEYAEVNSKTDQRGVHKDGPTWLLVNKQNRRLEVVPNNKPDGTDLHRYKGQDGSAVSDSHIYIGEPLTLRLMCGTLTLLVQLCEMRFPRRYARRGIQTISRRAWTVQMARMMRAGRM
jgi:hypothetical protein